MTTIVYVAGVGRSGSTLLESVLGSLPGWFGVGETMHLPERGLRDDQRCGCGEPFHSCPFWTEVGERAFGGWANVDAQDWIARARRVDRNRNLPLLLRPGLRAGFAAEHRLLVERIGTLIESAAAVSGAQVVVESSKHPSYGLLLAADPRFDFRCVHVVRDSRGVAYSWTKQVQRPEIHDRVEYMPTYAPTRIAARWLAWNGALSAIGLRRAATPVLRVRYEDFVADPERTVERVASFAGDPTAANGVGDLLASGLRATQHSVAGNPMRFGTGPVRLRLDEQWRDELAPADRRAVSVLTAPLLAAYGYSVTRGGGRRS